jgi:hypothetical protein
MIWRRGLVGNASCGCGEAFRDCPFWTAVGERAFGGWDRVDVDEAMGLRGTLDRGWTTPVLASPWLPRGMRTGLARYGQLLSPLYAAIAQEAGASVVVDSSKLPSHAAILRRLPGIEVRLVHLIRDSRGVAYSWQKDVVKDPATGERMLRYRPWSAATRYDLYNAMTGAVGWTSTPYVRVRYEDLVADPAPQVRRIVAHVDPGAEPDLSFIDGNEVRLGTDHTIGGNPMRFTQGVTTIRTDETWRSRLPSSDRLWVTGLTAPLLLRYGYELRTAGRAADDGGTS